MAPPPSTSQSKQYNVLITGYGPFGRITANPSWGCLQPLHGTTLRTASSQHLIRITALGPIRVTYAAVCALVPQIHTAPPSHPPLEQILHGYTSDPSKPEPPPPPPRLPLGLLPKDGFDMILHLGAGHNGAVSVELVGHGRSYGTKDVDGKLPPVAKVGSGGGGSSSLSEAARFEKERMGQSGDEDAGEEGELGYGEGYECFPASLKTEVDGEGLVAHLRSALNEKRIHTSTDAGYFLCDFICYGSLAESQRPLHDPASLPATQQGRKRAKTLFMHVPYDIGQPFEMEELTRIVRESICWICTGEGEDSTNRIP